MEDYEKKYKEALNWMKDVYLTLKGAAKEDAEHYFPELKESEDERIRKEIVTYLTQSANSATLKVNTQKFNKWIAWLEKQDKHKLDDKVEPKFKVGDWIVSDVAHEDYRICKILDDDGEYVIESIYGYRGHNSFETFDKDYHIWTIADAKDGDILAHKYGSVFIYAGFEDGCRHGRRHVDTYCYISAAHEVFLLEDGTGFWYYIDDIKPATSEERNLLFQMMKEAGWKWDVEKKELKKIEQNPTWTKEDEERYLSCLQKLSTGNIEQPETVNTVWLKSIKERYTWKPSDEQMTALSAINVTGSISYAGQGQELISLYNDLKKLKG